MTGKLLIFGCGYSAQAFVRRLGQGWQVTGTTRDPAKKAQMKAQGIDARLWPGEDLRPALQEENTDFQFFVIWAQDVAGLGVISIQDTSKPYTARTAEMKSYP